ncbi:MAG: hypothetical protein ACFCUG_14105 [Thiotrichales bacterium]
MTQKTISAESARKSASWFDIGNIVAIAIPVLIPLWFGGSMLLYAMMRHHPNPRVGHYTQWAAYRFYGLIGAIIPIATFFTQGVKPYLIVWVIAALILIPWSVYNLWRIRQDDWHDTVYDAPTTTLEDSH